MEVPIELQDLDARKHAIQQLVVELLAPYHSRLQPIELVWLSPTTAHPDQKLSLTLQHESEPRVMIPFTQSQFDTAVGLHDDDAYARLREYIWGKVRPLIH
jgi:hypothetical protein